MSDAIYRMTSWLLEQQGVIFAARIIRPTERRCTECKKTKPLDSKHFGTRQDGYNHGFQSRCKMCMNLGMRLLRQRKSRRSNA